MNRLFEVRQEQGGTFVTAFSDDLIIPWKPLSVGDYIKYHHETIRGAIPPSLIEDEIFKKCVLDDTLVRQMPFLNAGVVSTVVQNIWQFSGPTGIESFNSDIEMARAVLQDSHTKAMHQLVQVITLAFPYKPEEIYNMDYETFVLRVVQAEAKLLEAGMLKEPIRMQEEGQEKGQATRRPQVDAKRLWEERRMLAQQERKTPPAASQDVSGPSRDPYKKWWKVSPILETEGRKKINFQAESDLANAYHLNNHDKHEHPIMQKHLLDMKTKGERDKLIETARWVYKDVIEALEKERKENQ
jgi:hypothetical protein